MRIGYLANVGTRDVQRQGKFLDKARPDGAALLADYASVKAQLSSPILSAGLRHVLQMADSIACVQLFASDQPTPPATKAVFWEKDTLEFGKLLQRLLREAFGSRLARIECEPMHCNPADYNRTLPFFAERLPHLLPPNEIDVVYVAPVGGADASNVALTLNAVRCYRQKCQFIYVMPDGNVQLLNLHHELLGDHARREVLAHLGQHDYRALHQVLEQARLGKTWHLHLCDYTDRRTRFDFARADAALQAALATADAGEAVVQLGRLRESLAPFLIVRKAPTSASDGSAWDDWLALQRLLLGELFFNLRLKAEGGEWVDFLGRLFRLHEALLRLVFEMETRHSTDGSDRNGYPDFEKAVASDADLSALAIDRRPTTYALGEILQFWVRQAGKGAYGSVEGIRGPIEALSTLRNKSIIAHGYQAVSEEDITRELKNMTAANLLDRLRVPLQRLGANLSTEKDPYAAADQLLRTALE